MTLYHKDIYIPKQIQSIPFQKVSLRFSNHAILGAKSDRYGQIELWDCICFSGNDIIEAEVIENRLIKIVVRVFYNNRFDVCYVICPENLIVKTVWLNDRSDCHSTLNRSKYANH